MCVFASWLYTHGALNHTLTGCHSRHYPQRTGDFRQYFRQSRWYSGSVYFFIRTSSIPFTAVVMRVGYVPSYYCQYYYIVIGIMRTSISRRLRSTGITYRDIFVAYCLLFILNANHLIYFIVIYKYMHVFESIFIPLSYNGWSLNGHQNYMTCSQISNVNVWRIGM